MICIATFAALIGLAAVAGAAALIQQETHLSEAITNTVATRTFALGLFLLIAIISAGGLAWWLTYRHLKAWIITVSVLLLGVAAAYFAAHMHGVRTLEKEGARWNAEGRPMTVREMLPQGLEINSDGNAATWYIRANERLGKLPAEDDERLSRWHETENLNELRILVGHHHDALELLRQGSQRQHAVWPGDYDSPYDILCPDLTRLRQLAHLALAAARLATAANDPGTADQWLVTTAQLSRHIAEMPVVIMHLVGGSIARETARGMELLYRDRNEIPVPVANALARINHRQTQERAITSETVAWCHYWLPDVSLLNGCIAGYWLARSCDVLDSPAGRRLITPGELHRQAACYLRHMAAVASFYRKPIHDRPDNFNVIGGDIFAMFVPALGAYDEHVTVTKIRTLQARLAMRLRSYKHQHGTYPDSLNALGEIPPDPATGKPMDYRRKGDGFVLHSAFIKDNWPDDPDAARWRWLR